MRPIKNKTMGLQIFCGRLLLIHNHVSYLDLNDLLSSSKGRKKAPRRVFSDSDVELISDGKDEESDSSDDFVTNKKKTKKKKHSTDDNDDDDDESSSDSFEFKKFVF
jgi:hypothetical protein